MEVIEKTISNLIENQFPSFYKEQGSVFIEFVKQYYKWLETENALKHSRNFFEYKDIDEIIEVNVANKIVNIVAKMEPVAVLMY
jgi:RNA-splicing ligase RtcB